MFTSKQPGASGEMPDLLRLLFDLYCAERASQKSPVSRKEAEDFLVWARAYLSENRPTEVFPVDNNCGVQLSNGQRICISPNVAGPYRRSGDMANPDNSISIMEVK